MLESGKKVVCILGGLLFCVGTQAITDDSANPYQGIVERNVFGLKPPTPQATIDTKKPDLPPIILTGITTILGNKRVLMNVQSPGKPVQSFILTEGQRDGDIEVLEIDEKAGSVKVSQSGTIVPLTFEKNGAKLPASALVQTGPGVPTPVAGGAQLPGANPFAPGVGPTAGLKTIPTRQIRTSENASAGTPNYGGGSSGFAPTPGLVSPQPEGQFSVPALSRDEAIMNMLVQHVQNTDQGNTMPPLIPPLAELMEEKPPGQGTPATPNPRGPFLSRPPGFPQ